jgi:hypothetical protein
VTHDKFAGKVDAEAAALDVVDPVVLDDDVRAAFVRIDAAAAGNLEI